MAFLNIEDTNSIGISDVHEKRLMLLSQSHFMRFMGNEGTLVSGNPRLHSNQIDQRHGHLSLSLPGKTYQRPYRRTHSRHQVFVVPLMLFFGNFCSFSSSGLLVECILLFSRAPPDDLLHEIGEAQEPRGFTKLGAGAWGETHFSYERAVEIARPQLKP